MLSLLKNSIVIDVMKNNHNCYVHMTRIRAVCISRKPTSIVQCAQHSSNILPTLRCHILITYKQENSSRAEPARLGSNILDGGSARLGSNILDGGSARLEFSNPAAHSSRAAARISARLVAFTNVHNMGGCIGACGLWRGAAWRVAWTVAYRVHPPVAREPRTLHRVVSICGL